MYQTGGTVKETLDAIQGHNLVLPAIQREFVWRPGQNSSRCPHLRITLAPA